MNSDAELDELAERHKAERNKVNARYELLWSAMLTRQKVEQEGFDARRLLERNVLYAKQEAEFDEIDAKHSGLLTEEEPK